MPNEILNLDAILPEESYIIFRGTKHPIHPLTTRDYLELIREQHRNAKQRAQESDEVINTQYALKLIHGAVPSISMEELEALPVGAIQALSEAIQRATEMKSDDEEGEGDGEDEGNSTSP